MTTAPVSLHRDSWLRPKYLLFGFLGLMLIYVLGHNERFLIDARDSEWPHIQTFKWWLLPHGLAGACALLLGPMQFFDRLRQRHTKLHRVVGRFYVVATFISAPLGFYVQHFQERMGATHSFSIAAGMQAITWTFTTAVAMVFILKGNVQQHRQWMTRSFAVALVFLEVRVILGVTGWESHGPAAVETVVWICNVLAILLADLVLQWQEFRRLRLQPR